MVVLLVMVALVMIALVVVLFKATRLVMLATVAMSEEKKPLVEVAFVAVRLVIVALVVVELPMMRSVIDAKVATSEEMKELVVVLLVVFKLAKEADVAVREPIEVVARTVDPVNVLSPAKVWVVVEITPRAFAPAFGTLKVCVAPEELMDISLPVLPTAKN